MLELVEANPYTIRAYRRAAETIRSAAVPVADLVRSKRVRELRGIGQGIEARLRELVETGQIAELAELERELSPDLVGLGRYLGLGAKRSIELARSLGVRTADELREAAAAGRLRDVPGIGAKTEALLLEALAREQDAAAAAGASAQPRPRAGRRRRGRARRRAGGRRPAVARLVRAARGRHAPRPTPSAVLDRFAALPQIVALLERERAARGRGHGRGRSDRVRRRRARAVRDRAGPGDGLARRTSRRSSRSPTRPTSSRCTRRSASPGCPPELREAAVRRRAAGAGRARRHPRRPALPHDLVRRPRERRGDGPGGARARLRLPRDLRSHAGGRRGARPHPRRRPPAGRGDRRRQRGARAVPGAARDRVRHPRRRAARPPRRRPRRARLGPGQRARRPADARDRR